MFDETKADVCQNQSHADPLEQHDTQRALQLGHLARQRRLCQGERPGRGGEGAVVCCSAEGPCQIPIHLTHTYLYICSTKFGNSVYLCKR